MDRIESSWIDDVKSSTFDLRDLAENIEQQVADYLALEFVDGSTFKLDFVGGFILRQKPIKCWEFAQTRMYVTVQPYLDNFLTSLTEKDVILKSS